jgi:hypothetical protein
MKLLDVKITQRKSNYRGKFYRHDPEGHARYKDIITIKKHKDFLRVGEERNRIYHLKIIFLNL